MESFIQDLLRSAKLPAELSHALAMAASILVLAAVTTVVGLICKSIIFRVMLAMIARSQTKWDDFLLTKTLFTRLTWTILAVTAFILLWALIPQESPSFGWLRRILLATITLTATAAIFTFISNGVNAIHALQGENHVPVKSYAQVAKIIIGLVAAVLAISSLSDQSPLGILAGIGTMTAVLLFVFKDSLLGFLASLQISSQDMVKVGDWIEMPAQFIDGEVQDISLNIIKVKNWDNTVSSIPTYALVSGSFKNWRHMKDSGGRRVKRSIPLDSSSISLLDEKLAAGLAGLSELRGYLERETSDFRSLTNLGAFRVYAQAYLDRHPGIHQDMGRMVRQLENQGRGLPLECLFFSTVTGGAGYEALVSEVFEHLYAVLPRFGLRVFQEPTSHTSVIG